MTAGLDGNNNLIWTISASPSFSMVTPNQTSNVSSDVYSKPDDLEKTKNVWIKCIGEFPNAEPFEDENQKKIRELQKKLNELQSKEKN